jgi:hypothetical protein
MAWMTSIHVVDGPSVREARGQVADALEVDRRVLVIAAL